MSKFLFFFLLLLLNDWSENCVIIKNWKTVWPNLDYYIFPIAKWYKLKEMVRQIKVNYFTIIDQTHEVFSKN